MISATCELQLGRLPMPLNVVATSLHSARVCELPEVVVDQINPHIFSAVNIKMRDSLSHISADPVNLLKILATPDSGV